MREQLEKLDLAEGRDGKLRGCGQRAREATAHTEAVTNPVFLVVHDDLLQRHQNAGTPRSRLVDLTVFKKFSLVVAATRTKGYTSLARLTQKYPHQACRAGRSR